MMKVVWQMTFWLLFFPLHGLGKSTILESELYQEQETLYTNVKAQIDLPNETEQAVRNGLVLIFTYQFDIRNKEWLVGKSLAKLKKNYQLSYNQITDEFSIYNSVTQQVDYFRSFNAVKQFMAKLTHFPLILVKELPHKPTILRIRFYLALDNLPTYLKLEHLINNPWDINSDWTTWPIPLTKVN